MDSFAFHIRQPRDSAGVLVGTLRLEPGEIVIQWIEERSFFPREQKLHEKIMPFVQIASAEVITAWLRSPRLQISSRTMDVAGMLPGIHPPGKIDLWIAKTDLEKVRAIASIINMHASQALLDRVVDPLAR